MDERLKKYSKEEIEKLALSGLDSDKEITTLEIKRIDKEYKKHNKDAVIKAVGNGTIILLFASIFLSSDIDFSNYNFDKLSDLYYSIIDKLNFLPNSETYTATYTMMFEKVNYIVNQIGIIGLLLAIKSMKFILSSLKDTKKSIKMKKEINLLKNKLEEMEYHI